MHVLFWACMCELKPTSSQAGQQVANRSKYQQLEWEHKPQVLTGLGANNWGTPRGQDFSNYTDHLKLATTGTHIASVSVSLKIPLLDLHPEELERRNRTGLSMQLFLECSVRAYVGTNKSTGLSLLICVASCVCIVCMWVCVHTRTPSGNKGSVGLLAGPGDAELQQLCTYLFSWDRRYAPGTQSPPHLATSNNWHG